MGSIRELHAQQMATLAHTAVRDICLSHLTRDCNSADGIVLLMRTLATGKAAGYLRQVTLAYLHMHRFQARMTIGNRPVHMNQAYTRNLFIIQVSMYLLVTYNPQHTCLKRWTAYK